jgi:phosphoglycerate kinase
LVAVIGGTGASRLDWIEALLGKASTICVGGAIANTLLTASGTKMGSSPIDEQALARGRALLGRARDRGTALVLPLDVAIGDRPDTGSSRVVAKGDVPNDAMALDIGPRTLEAFGRAVASAKAVLFVGALGAADNPLFATGTREVARALAESSAFSVLGGDSELPALTGAEWIDKLSFISTGGDVGLELFVGRRLPGLEALRGGAT